MIKLNEVNKMPNPANYYCTNIELAAALTSLELELSSIEKDPEGMVYIFPPQIHLVEMVEKYYTDELTLSPRKVLSNLAILKELGASIGNAKRDTEFGS